ncbi:MAG TPA: hypothetical protein VFU47_17205, partial [Armatimonadota bacterium]|nr:hypothetical protein [Armatimonadota bacterium]
RRCFLKARELAPEDWRLDLRIGMAYNAAGMHAEARGPLLSAGRQAGKNPLVLYHLGWMHEGAGEWRLATGYYERALAVRPDFTEAAQRLHGVKSSALLGRLWRRLTGKR